MKRILMSSAIIAAVLGMCLFPCFGQHLFEFKLGPSWPEGRLKMASPVFDIGLAYGLIVDRKVGFGLATDFLWSTKTSEVPSNGLYKITSDEQFYMFPIMGFFLLDPMPDMVIHPVAHFNIGYNSMIYSVKMDSTSSAGNRPTSSVSPYYYGLIVKTGIDGLYNIGERSALFLGLEYQWAGTATKSNSENLFDKRDMSGLCLRFGFRAIL
jgi:hypothetical protein